MNLFKKIGAALLASALALTTAVTASAETTDGIKISIEKLDEESGGLGITIGNLPSQYAQCDYLDVRVEFLSLYQADNNLGWINKQSTDYYLLSRVDKTTYPMGAYFIGNTKTNTFTDISGMCVYNANTNTYAIAYENNDLYRNTMDKCNAILIYVYGFIGNERVVYSNDGEVSKNPTAIMYRFKELYMDTATSEPTTSEPTTSEPTTSEPTSSEPTSSEPTSSEPTSSEPTSSEPTSSEPTSSEPTSSEPTSSEPTTSEPATSEPTSSEPTSSEPTTSEHTSSETNKAEPSDTTNPATGVTTVIIGAVTIAGATVVATVKRKKR